MFNEYRHIQGRLKVLKSLICLNFLCLAAFIFLLSVLVAPKGLDTIPFYLLAPVLLSGSCLFLYKYWSDKELQWYKTYEKDILQLAEKQTFSVRQVRRVPETDTHIASFTTGFQEATHVYRLEVFLNDKWEDMTIACTVEDIKMDALSVYVFPKQTFAYKENIWFNPHLHKAVE